MFMAAVCFYIIICSITPLIGNEDISYHITFALLIHGVIISMSASIVWTLILSIKKIKSAFLRTLLCSIIIVIMLGISIFIPVLNSSNGFIIWILSCIISLFGFGILLAVYSEIYFKKTGIRSVLVWEIK